MTPSQLDDLLRRLGGAAGAKWGVVEAGRRLSDYPAAATMLRQTPVKYMPPAGTEVFSVDPYALIGELAYPAGLAAEARRRLLQSPYQSQVSGRLDWLYMRPGREVVPQTPARAIVTFPRNEEATQASAVYDLATDAAGATRNLLHELRHGTNTRDFFRKRSAPSVSRAYRASFPPGDTMLRSPRLLQEYQSYLAQPTEMLSYISEAGDDFVRANQRLIASPTDANEAMAMWAENNSAVADPLVRGFYDRAYTQAPEVRKRMQDMLMRYYAVPGAVAAGAATGSEQ